MVTTPIAVTVFTDRARVTRAGRMALAAGLQQLEVTDLPLNLLPDSVRAGGRGAAHARLLGVSTRLDHFTETPAARARELEQAIQAQEDADHDRLAQIEVLEKEIAHLTGLAQQSEMFARGLALRDRTAEQQTAIFATLSARQAAVRAEVLRLSRERRDLARELDRLRRELKEVQSARPRQRYAAVVEVDVSQPGEFTLELTYVVTGARWKPLYDLRLGEAGLELTYLAEVAQNTGEEWPGVELSLSTAQASLALEVPELDPWFISPIRPMPAPQPKMAMRAVAAPSPAQAVAAFVAPAAEAAPVQMLEAEHALSEVSESGAALTYRLGSRADVPGNGDPRKVTVAGFSLKPEIDYVTAPKAQDVCYRRARLKNTSAYTLLPGQAQLFEGDDYLGATRLDLTAPNQEIELALGADERLRVKRELAQREVDKTFIGDRRRIRYAYTIEVENARDLPQTVIVRDQMPVARDEQIKVRLEASEPKPSEQSDLNLLEWKLNLAKGAKQTIRFDFTVEHPRAMDVRGLP